MCNLASNLPISWLSPTLESGIYSITKNEISSYVPKVIGSGMRIAMTFCNAIRLAFSACNISIWLALFVFTKNLCLLLLTNHEEFMSPPVTKLYSSILNSIFSESEMAVAIFTPMHLYTYNYIAIWALWKSAIALIKPKLLHTLSSKLNSSP